MPKQLALRLRGGSDAASTPPFKYRRTTMSVEALKEAFLVARKAADAAWEAERKTRKVFKETLQVAWETAKEEEGEAWKEVMQIAWKVQRGAREETKEAFEAEEKAFAAEAAYKAACEARAALVARGVAEAERKIQEAVIAEWEAIDASQKALEANDIRAALEAGDALRKAQDRCRAAYATWEAWKVAGAASTQSF